MGPGRLEPCQWPWKNTDPEPWKPTSPYKSDHWILGSNPWIQPTLGRVALVLFYWKSPCVSGPNGSHLRCSRVNCIITASALIPGSSELRPERLCLPSTAHMVRLSLGSPCGPAHVWDVTGMWRWPWDMLLWHVCRCELKVVGSQRVQKTAFQEPPSSDSRQSFWTWDAIGSRSGWGVGWLRRRQSWHWDASSQTRLTTMAHTVCISPYVFLLTMSCPWKPTPLPTTYCPLLRV